MTWRRENSCPTGAGTLDTSVIQSIASRYTNYAIRAPRTTEKKKYKQNYDSIPHEKDPLEKIKCNGDNITLYLIEIGYQDRNWEPVS
jgi:hypothetical protein